MNLYAFDHSLYDFANFSDPVIPRYDRTSLSGFPYDDAADDDYHRKGAYDGGGSSKSKAGIGDGRRSPLQHRHDGTSPLPLGMDWSLPPLKWDGRDSVWPHDHRTGWSYCVTIPSWILLPDSRGSDPVAFFRVQVGVQSPEGFTTTRGILRRFSDFLKLLSELKKAFPRKELPQAPPKRMLRLKRRTVLEERRWLLEAWMEKLLSDISISRSAPVAMFLELEAAARSSFNDQQNSDAHSSGSGVVPSFLFQTNSDVSVHAGGSSIASDHGIDSHDGISEHGTPRHGRQKSEHSTSGQNKNNTIGDSSQSGAFDMQEPEYQSLDGHIRSFSAGSIRSDLSSVRASEKSNFGIPDLFGDSSFGHRGGETSGTLDAYISSDSAIERDSLVVLPSENRIKINKVLNAMQQRLATAKTDMEDLTARLNQEVTVRQFLTTKVKDLEVEVETTRENCKENMQQAVFTEKERFTQMQWDIEELRKQCLEMHMKLKHEQEEKARAEESKLSIFQENEILLQELEVAREQLENLYKDHEELEVKSKADKKLLVKEVKSLRSSHSELKQELSRLMKDKLEVERILEKEKLRTERANVVNSKLLHECEILRNRLQEVSVNFLSEEDDKLNVDTSSLSDAIDLLTTSDNRIGLLLAESQLLAQDIEKSMTRPDETRSSSGGDQRSDDDLRKMLTDMFVDNARLRMQMNSVIRYALNTHVNSDKDDDNEEETPLRKTVLGKFLEK